MRTVKHRLTGGESFGDLEIVRADDFKVVWRRVGERRDHVSVLVDGTKFREGRVWRDLSSMMKMYGK